ncbi:MAG TPA: ribbon-helix-helix protein, CopG family [Bryobacteraceae bacterium]|nr:ribbon-helix-helix protein, CopG family [Bryobacteraceae bacterium]
MTTDKQPLIPTSIRIDAESLRQLTEAAALQQTTRTELLREAITEILNRWKVERRVMIQKLMETS